MHQKLVPDPLLILVNNSKQPLYARNSFTSKILWKIIKNPYKSQIYFFFWNQSPLMDRVIENKSGLELVPSRSSGYEKSPEKFFY